jgi:allantoin racemase
VCIDPVYVPWHREQVRRYGLEGRVVDVRAMVMSPAEAVAAFDDVPAYERIKYSFLGLASKMIAESGVDVVMSAGGLFALLGARDPALEIEGALIANPTLLAVKQAELAVSVARTTGQAVSRGSAFAKASKQSIYEFMELAAPNRH